MTKDAVPNATIDSAAYSGEYFLTAVEGHQEFRTSMGRRLSPRLMRALELADPRPGQRVLDIGCGRGEIVLQSTLRGAFAVIRVDAVVAEAPHALGQRRIVRGHHAAFRGGDVFDGVKAEGVEIGDAANLAAVVLRPQGVTGVCK